MTAATTAATTATNRTATTVCLHTVPYTRAVNTGAGHVQLSSRHVSTAGVRGVDTGRDDGPWTGAVNTRRWTRAVESTAREHGTAGGHGPWTRALYTGWVYGPWTRDVFTGRRNRSAVSVSSRTLKSTVVDVVVVDIGDSPFSDTCFENSGHVHAGPTKGRGLALAFGVTVTITVRVWVFRVGVTFGWHVFVMLVFGENNGADVLWG